MCRTNVYLLQQRQRARSHSGHFFLITKLFEQKKCSRSSACWPSRPSSGSRSSWLCSEETSSNGRHEFEQSGKVPVVLISVSNIFKSQAWRGLAQKKRVYQGSHSGWSRLDHEYDENQSWKASALLLCLHPMSTAWPIKSWKLATLEDQSKDFSETNRDENF